MTEAKDWKEISKNDCLVMMLWNRFVKEDEEMAVETAGYGERFMRVYRNTFDGLYKAYCGDMLRFAKDNMSFWGDAGSRCEGYLFSDGYFVTDCSSSEEIFATSDDSVVNLVASIIHRNLGETGDGPTMARFIEFCRANVTEDAVK